MCPFLDRLLEQRPTESVSFDYKNSAKAGNVGKLGRFIIVGI